MRAQRESCAFKKKKNTKMREENLETCIKLLKAHI